MLNKYSYPIFFNAFIFITVVILSQSAHAASPVAGSGNCLRLNGTSDFVSVPSSGASSTWTLEFWVKPNSPVNLQRLFTQGSSANVNRQMSARWVNGKIQFYTTTDSVGGTPQISSKTITDDNSTWTHVAWTFDGATHNVFVNGVDSSETVGSGTANVLGNMYIGCYSGNSYYFTGSLDEFRLWSGVKSQTDIINNMYMSLDSSSAAANNLLLYFRCDESIGTSLADYTDIQQNGTITGGVFTSSDAWKHRFVDDTLQLTHGAGHDPDRDPITITQVIAPQDGTLLFNNTARTVTYTPVVYSTGIKTYTYQVSDGTNIDIYDMSVRVDAAATDPYIDVEPVDDTAYSGDDGLFFLSAVGSGTLSYRWRWWHDDSSRWEDLPGETDDTLALNSVNMGMNGYYYYCVVSSAGGSKNSNVVQLTVLASGNVTITTEPVAQRDVATGDSVIFSVIASGSGTLNYQWDKYSGSAWGVISGATSNQYTIDPVAKSHAGTYRVRVWNSTTADTSVDVTLNAYDPPQITVHPQSQAISVDSIATFTVTASGDSLSYQWQIKPPAGTWSDTANATASSVTTPPATLSMSGTQYRCIVSSIVGMPDTSNAATLTVGQSILPKIITDLDSLYEVASGDSVVFVIEAIGMATLQYRWEKQIASLWDTITGVTSDSYEIDPINTSHAGLYRAIVWNDSGADTSATARLAVGGPLTIEIQPTNDTVLIDSTFTFWLKATGGGSSINYQWQRREGGNFIDIPGATDSSYSKKTTIDDGGAWFKCVVSSGSFKDTSDVAILILGQRPTVPVSPRDTAASTGVSLSLNASSSGVPKPLMKWFFVRPGTAPVLRDSGYDFNTFNISSTLKADSGYFYIVASNKYGSFVSDSGFVHVLDPVRVTLDIPSQYSTIDGGAVKFSIGAEGDGTLSYQWYSENNPISNARVSSYSIDTVDSVIHHGKTYHCVVKNDFIGTLNGASDTILIGTVSSSTSTLVVGEFYNPFKVKVERSNIHDIYRVRMKLWSDINISNFPFAVDPFKKYADSLWVIHKSMSYPVQILGASVLRFPIQSIVEAYPDTLVLDSVFLDTLELPNDSYSYFSYSVKWRGPLKPDTLLEPFTNANRVLRKDTTASPNRLVVYGQYYDRTDSALITIDSTQLLNVSTDATVIVQSSKYQNYATLTSSDTFSVSQLINAGTSYNFAINRIDSLPIETKPYYCRWYIIGTNSSTSEIKDTTFTIGWDRPVWIGAFNAMPTSRSDQVAFAWQGQANIDSMRIWWDTDTIPFEHEYSVLYQSTQHLPHIVTKTNIIDTLKGLSPKTKYFFGAQILKDQLWSSVSFISRDTASTIEGQGRVPNTVRVDSSWFDTDSNHIVLQWFVDTSEAPTDKVFRSGYTYAQGGPLDTINNTPSQLFAVPGTNNIARVKVSDIVWGGTYIVGVWLCSYDDINGPGILSPPTDSSTDTIQIPSFTWEAITFFRDISQENEIDSIANGRIVLKEVTNFSRGETDVLRAFQPNVDSLPKELVIIDALSFKFSRTDYQVPDFILELPYGNLPPGISEENLGLYQYVNGKVNVIHGFQVANGAVSALIGIKDLNGHPFIVLADTTAPEIVINNDNEIADINAKITTSFTVTDNISNVQCRFMYAKGDTKFKIINIDTTVLSFDSAKLTKSIEANSSEISDYCGIRILLIANDGVNQDTINASRCIKTINVGSFSIPELAWVPLRATATLDDSLLENTFNRVSSEKWEYNTKKIRLFRFYDSDSGTVNSYMEYADSVKQHFNFVPGRLIWCKALTSQSLNFGGGATVSLRKPYTIPLKANSWTDFCLPFQFSIKLKDVLNATGLMADSLDFYYWRKDSTSYKTERMYISSIDMGKPITDTLISKQKYDGYTVFNKSPSDIILSIPPIPLPLSSHGSTKRSQEDLPKDRWDISFFWKDKEKHTLFREVICAYNKNIGDRVVFGSLPPSMSRMKIGILDTLRQSIHGYAISNNLDKGGTFFKIEFRNQSSADANIEYRLDNLSILPDGYSAQILNPNTRAYEPCNDSLLSEVRVSSGSNNTVKRLVVVGTNEYLNDVLRWISPLTFKFLKAYPNPFNGIIRLNYTLPPDIGEVQLSLYNVLGRRLWKSMLRKGISAGEHTVTFNSRTDLGANGVLPTGVYILRLSAKDKAGKIIFGGERKITCIK